MANEYKLSYTAKDIDLKLGKIEEIENSLENKQDKLAFDEVPTEGSENLVKSGAIHAALQNVGGGTDLAAGDFIEIKDGVVRCTFGDLISGELKEEIEDTYGTHTLEMANEEGSLYMGAIPMNEYGLPSIGDVLEVAFTPSGETTPTNFTVETTPFLIEDGETYMWSAGCNATCTLEMEFTVIDDTKPAIFLAFSYDDGELDAPMMMIVSATDYTGGTLTVGTKTITDTRKYALLPDNALGLGREIVTEVNEELVNVKSIEMAEDDIFMAVITPPKLPENGTTLEVAFTPSGESQPINLTAEVTELIIDGEFISWIASCNATFSLDDGSITAIDETLPAFVIQMGYYDGDLDAPMMMIGSATDYTGASIVINHKVVKIGRVTLPNEALNFDSEPTEGSTNLVNSGSVYEAIQNAQPNLTFDEAPTENSENLINSGSVYNAINSIDIEPQLIEGFYIYNGVIERDPNVISLSANKRAIPAAQNAWVEGRAAEIGRYYNCTLGRVNQWSGLNVIFYYDFETEGEVQWEIDVINNKYEYMFVIFEDEPDRQYLIRSGEAYKTETGRGLYFYFDQMKGHEFPFITTYPDIRNIKEVICIPRIGDCSHSEGYGLAIGNVSHAEGKGTIASAQCSHVQGTYNIEDTKNKYAHIVGNGSSDRNRSNAHTIDWDGNAWFAGDIYVGDNKRVLTEDGAADITIGSIKTDVINIGTPGDNIISEIITRTFDNGKSGRVLGQNILVPGWWYLVTYDGFEYILTPDVEGSFYYMGDHSKYGFRITQAINDSYKVTNMITPDDNEHTITISRLETSRINLMDYILKLEEKVNDNVGGGGTDLVAGDGIEIKDGVIRSTLGNLVINESLIEVLNVDNIELDYNDGEGQVEFEADLIPDIDTILEVALTLPGETKPINYTTKVVEFDVIAALCNIDETFSAIDATLPAFVILMDDSAIVINSLTDFTGGSLVINAKTITKTNVKLPNEALSFDTEPIEGSENLINSGDLYNVINGLKPEAQLIENSKGGFSANKDTIPTGEKVWIEGGGSNPYEYLDSHNMFAEVVVENQKAEIRIQSSNSELIQEIYEKISGNYISFCIADKKYFATQINTPQLSNYNNLIFEIKFVDNDELSVGDVFPINIDTDTYWGSIKNLTIYPKNGSYSHSEGYGCVASGESAHAEGAFSKANGYRSHAEGNTTASGEYSHSEGMGTTASGNYQHVQGRFNIEDTEGKYAHIVGNGIGNMPGYTGEEYSNAHTVDWNGNAWYAGSVEATAIILKSSTEGSTKRFKVTVDDNGTLSATEIV